MLFIEKIDLINGKRILLIHAYNFFHPCIALWIIMPTCRLCERYRDDLYRVVCEREPGITVECWLADNMLDGHFFS